MIEFQPIVTLGSITVLVTVTLLFATLYIRSKKNMRRLDKAEAKMQAMEDQMRSLAQSLARTPSA